MWAKKGKKHQPLVRTGSQHQNRLNVFGWVDPLYGRHRMIQCEKGNTDGFISVLMDIQRTFMGKTIHLWIDRARWHRGKRVDEFFHMHKQFTLHYLPAYHPELNFQESLWRMMRYEETTNVYFETMDKLISGVFKRSQRWKPKKIISLCHLI
jgi:hypothetical protein